MCVCGKLPRLENAENKKNGNTYGNCEKFGEDKNEDLKITKLCTTSHMGKDDGEVLALFQN